MMRVGIGYDVHAFAPPEAGRPLLIGGVKIPHDRGLAGHSDADVLLHALVDALLGAAGLGDIGEHFPDSEPAWKGAPSSMFLEKVMHELKTAGWSVVNADVTIMAERPKIRPFKGNMISHLSAHLGCAVNIKAGTNEGCDAVGRGEAVAAHAVVLIHRP